MDDAHGTHAGTGGGAQLRNARAAASTHAAVFPASGASGPKRGTASATGSFEVRDVIRCAAHSTIAQHHSGTTDRAKGTNTNSSAGILGQRKRLRRILDSVDAGAPAGGRSTPADQPVSRERP